LYVDTATRKRRLSPVQRKRLADRINTLRRELVEDFAWVARLMADVTAEAGVAVRPFGSGQILEAISLLPLDGGRVLGLLVTADGAVIKRVLTPDDPPERERLLEISNLVSDRYRGREIDDVAEEVREVGDDHSLVPGPELEREANVLMLELLPVDEVAVELQVAGTENLLHTDDFSEIERVRSLFATLEDEQRIVSEIRRALASESTRVIIGRESEITSSGELGMVTTLFFKNGKRAGAIGVMGPKRMDYARIVPVVEYVGDSLTQLLTEPGALHG
jgi:heat-inducible transcriptional repressor